MSTHLELISQKSLATLLSLNFRSQCVYVPLYRVIEIYMIHETHGGDLLLQEGIYILTYVFVSPHELQIFRSLENHEIHSSSIMLIIMIIYTFHFS